jgi:hypothetical protein
MKTGRELAKDLIKSQYSRERLTREAMVIGKDLASLLQVLPRHIRWLFRKLNQNGYAIEVKSPELREIREQMNINGQRMSLSVAAAGLFVASSIALQYASDQRIFNHPALAILLLGAGLLLLAKLLFKRGV